MRHYWTKPAVLTLFLAASLFSITSPASAASAGQSCKKVGALATSKSGGKTTKLVCTKVGKKLKWVAKGTKSRISCASGGVCVIGDIGPGRGIVFYDAGSIQPWGRYLEVVPEWWSGDRSERSAKWGCYDTSISGASGTAIGTGAANTAAIVAGCSESGTAAKLADALTYAGKSDWFLPSKDELNQMYLLFLKVGWAGAGGLNGGCCYWSSSEVVTNSLELAWQQEFFRHTRQDYSFGLKDFTSHVRPVRAF